MYFKSGEIYRLICKHDDLNQEDIFVLAIDEETSDGTWLAILWVDKKTREVSSADELFVSKENYKDWHETIELN